MSDVVQWDQSRFDRTLEAYVRAHYSHEWPRILNKKAARLCYRMIAETPFKEPSLIESELLRDVNARREDGSSGSVPIGYVMAAKRASRTWNKSLAAGWRAMVRGSGGGDELKAWRKAIKDKYRSMLGGRKRSAHFIQVGWISALQSMAAQGVPEASTRKPGTRIHGGLKGHVQIATSDRLNVSMTNTASAKRATSNAFESIGNQAMQRAFAHELADLEKYFHDEMSPGAAEFNRKQH